MDILTLQNFYKDSVKVAWTAGAGNFYVNTKPVPTSGILVVNPSSASKREIIRYSAVGTDGTGDYITVSTVADRGLGGTTAQTHAVDEPVRMNITAEHWENIQDAIDDLQADLAVAILAGASFASPTVAGIARLTNAPDKSIGTVTISIATPGVITRTAHGMLVNDRVKFTTTGALPTGIVASTEYYVIGTGLTADAFQISATLGGAAINTTGSQSGVHTLVRTTPYVVEDNDARIPTTAEKARIPSVDEDAALAGGGDYGTPSASNKFITQDFLNVNSVFGGDGSDGALAVTSGVTNIDLGGASIFVKQYSSISITGTGSIKFINPHASGTIIIIKSTGNVTITSSTSPAIDASGCGGAGGTVDPTGGSGDAGNNGNNGIGLLFGESARGTSVSGTPGTIYTNPVFFTDQEWKLSKNSLILAAGAGGAGGYGGGTGGSGILGGVGGNGGGVLIIQCKGALNFTGTISVAGTAGSAGQNGTGSSTGGGGGGGGSAGMCVVLYNTLTVNSGTINSAGGAGGASGTSAGITGNNAQGGGGAGSKNGAGGAGAVSGTGSAAASTGGGGGGGGSVDAVAGSNAGGAGGASYGGLIAKNYYF